MTPSWATPLTLALALGLADQGLGQAPTPNRFIPEPGLELKLWAREPMVQDPVAIQFDDQGVLYVAETARRGTVDIDIRAHRDWLVEDLTNQSIQDLREFFHRKMSVENSQLNAPWLKDYNGDGIHDWHDLESIRERIRRLEDTKNAGVADRSQIFTESFNEEISGVVAGVMPWGDSVLVTGYPELQRFQDTDHDGIADRHETLFRGFGVHAAFDGHDLHGLTIGPDGRIYFSNGDNGFSVTNREGKVLSYPNTGGVLRMDADGSHLEVFATGLRNPQEIAFDEYGNLFAVDNDGDLRDERERFVYITEGSDSGWRLHWQFRDRGWTDVTGQPEYNPWMDERMWIPQHPGQPAHITPPLSNYSVGPGSIRYNPGTGLNSKYERHFFLIQFPVQKVTAFQTKPKGAYFEMVNERTVLSGMMASALDFGPDGALYVGDWDGMWNPDGKGAIWKLDVPEASQSASRRQVQQWLKAGTASVPESELIERLGNGDVRIRLRAQFECVRRKLSDALLNVAKDSRRPELARIHALWGLGQFRNPDMSPRLPFRDTNAEIRAQVAKVAGDLRNPSVFPELVRGLSDESARVRFHAATALGKLGNARAIPYLVEQLEKNRDADAFLRHALILGMEGSGTAQVLGALHTHPNKSVRLGAVVALRRLHSPTVASFLGDTDADILREAARAIHDDLSIPSALPALAALVDVPSAMKDEAIARRVLSANLRIGTLDASKRLLRIANREDMAEPLRAEAVKSLALWGTTPYLDRVEGMIRAWNGTDPHSGRTTLIQGLDRLLQSPPPLLARTLTQVVLDKKLPARPEIFTEWVKSEQLPAATRSKALEYLASIKSPSVADATRSVLASPDASLRLTGLKVLASSSPDEFLNYIETQGSKLSLREKQLAMELSGPMSSKPAESFLIRSVAALQDGSLPKELELDVIEGSRRSPSSAVKLALKPIETRLSSQSPMDRLRPALLGGNAANGRELFQTSVRAQCSRCHDAGGEGSQAGPVLKGIGTRVSREYLLESLIDPSAKIAEGFGLLNITLKGGDSLDGIQLKQTPTELTMRLVTGETKTIPTSQIQARSANSISAMPPLGEVLSPMELRDVIEFLATWK